MEFQNTYGPRDRGDAERQQFTHPVSMIADRETARCWVSLGSSMATCRPHRQTLTNLNIAKCRVRVGKKELQKVSWRNPGGGESASSLRLYVGIQSAPPNGRAGGVASVHFLLHCRLLHNKSLDGATAPEREVGCASGTETGHVRCNLCHLPCINLIELCCSLLSLRPSTTSERVCVIRRILILYHGRYLGGNDDVKVFNGELRVPGFLDFSTKFLGVSFKYTHVQVETMGQGKVNSLVGWKEIIMQLPLPFLIA